MNILGIGTDIVQLSRIAELLEQYDNKLIERILTPQEQVQLAASSQPVSFFAKRFAAKEAVAKALGTGIGQVAFKEINISNLENGKPQVNFTGKAEEFVAKLNIKEVMISLSDEKEYALAFVVITLAD